VAEKRKVIPIADEALTLFDAAREMADQQKLDRPLSVSGLRVRVSGQVLNSMWVPANVSLN
jgi:hypothetical protein